MQPVEQSGDPRIAFWSRKGDWPDDVQPEHIFLARVVGIVGPVVFGSDWTGAEPAVELVTPLTEVLDASIPSSELQRGCRILFEHDKAYASRCPAFVEILCNWPIPSQEEWSRAVEISRRLSAQRRQEFGRFTEVCSRLANAFKQGSILTATRGVDGGLLQPLNRWFWNTENFWGRFCTCRVDLFDPYRAASTVSGGEYLFVDQATLEAVLQPSPEAVRTPDHFGVPEDEYLSPYLRCMIDATRALGITAGDMRKKQEIVVELPKHWQGASDDLTGADLERMATLMREPAHKGGRRYKKRQQ